MPQGGKHSSAIDSGIKTAAMADPAVQELTSILLATLNPSPVVRQAAELGLADGASKPGAGGGTGANPHRRSVPGSSAPCCGFPTPLPSAPPASAHGAAKELPLSISLLLSRRGLLSRR